MPVLASKRRVRRVLQGSALAPNRQNCVSVVVNNNKKKGSRNMGGGNTPQNPANPAPRLPLVFGRSPAVRTFLPTKKKREPAAALGRRDTHRCKASAA